MITGMVMGMVMAVVPVVVHMIVRIVRKTILLFFHTLLLYFTTTTTSLLLHLYLDCRALSLSLLYYMPSIFNPIPEYTMSGPWLNDIHGEKSFPAVT